MKFDIDRSSTYLWSDVPCSGATKKNGPKGPTSHEIEINTLEELILLSIATKSPLIITPKEIEYLPICDYYKESGHNSIEIYDTYRE